MIPAAFDYVRAGSPEEALEALADPEARVLAGGHSLLPMMKLRLAQPTLLVDITRLDWRGLDERPGELSIGALTTYDDLVRSPSTAIPDALRECAAAVGDVQVRNAGTVGGALAHADPASDLAAAVLALEARLQLSSLAGTRECAADDFFLGPFTTALGPQELLSALIIPLAAAGTGSAYVSVENPASGYPIAGAAVRARVEDGRIAECGVGLVGGAAQPIRAREVEDALRGGPPTLDRVRQAVAELELGHSELDPDYRRQLLAVTIVRAAEAAVRRAAPGGSA
jgi:carbon-monoxide dehydrogenase medium subunit